MPLDQIGPLLRRRQGRDLLDAVNPIPNTSYSRSSTNAPTPNEKAVEVDKSFAEQEIREEEFSTEDDAAVWSRTRAERQARIEQTYQNMARTATILRSQIGNEKLSKVVAAYPQVLMLDAEKQIMPVARYLMGGLGIWKDDLSSILQLYPALMGKSIYDLEQTVQYLLDLGVDEDDLGGIFRAFPVLFTIETQEMDAVVDYLRSEIGVSNVGQFVTRLPPVLGYSVEKEIKPKWEFLKKVCLQPLYELEQFPAYFSYPLARVIKTRFNYLAYKGRSRFSKRIDTVLRFGDTDFATRVAADTDGGHAFRQFCRRSSLSPSSKKKQNNMKQRRITKGKNANRSPNSGIATVPIKNSNKTKQSFPRHERERARTSSPPQQTPPKSWRRRRQPSSSPDDGTAGSFPSPA